MVLAIRVVMTTLIALTFWLSGGPAAAADPSLITAQFATVVVSSADDHNVADGQPTEPTGADTPRSILYAGIAGVTVGGVIAFWQSRRRRRKDVERPGDERDSSSN